uniref:Uncharacterized protein n=1 Tax=Anguilla anguilla TaxID=7936 RepID=A0A0E9WX35_ANGAN
MFIYSRTTQEIAFIYKNNCTCTKCDIVINRTNKDTTKQNKTKKL